MATWYLDPVNGNDANAGTSFATRCLTLAGMEAKSLTAGDTVRVIASPSMQTTGLIGTFNNSTPNHTITDGIANISTPIGSTLNNFNGWYSNTITNQGQSQILYGNGVFVLLPSASYTNIQYSYDGYTWVSGTTYSTGVTFYYGCYGNGLFVIPCSGNKVATSSDGINWTFTSVSYTFSGIAWNGTTFAAVVSSSNSIAYSSNGSSWTYGTGSSSQVWFTIAAIPGGNFVSITQAGLVQYSSNGSTWVAGTPLAALTWNQLIAVNGMLIALPYNNTGAAYSTNGTTFTTTTLPSALNWYGCAYANGVYVAVANGSAVYAYSTNGTSWVTGSTVGPALSNSTWVSAASNGSTIVATGQTGVLNVWTYDYPMPTAGAANVTTGFLSGTRKIGVNSAQFTVNSSFTTGQVGYFRCGDGNGFNAVSFKFRQSAGTVIAASNYTLTLCSDTAGATTVYTVPIPAIKVLNQWVTVAYSLGATLTSGNIKSISINRSTNSGAQTIQIDNVMACYATGNTAINHDTLVASNSSGPFYPIDNFTSNTIGIGCCPANSLTTVPGPIESGNYPLYFIQPLVIPPANQGTTLTDSTWGTVAKVGALGSPITYSGGWNSTDMSSQTGITYLSGGNGLGLFSYTSNKSYRSYSGINLVNWGSGFYYSSTSVNQTVIAQDICGCGSGALYLNAGGGSFSNFIVNVTNIHCNSGIAVSQLATSPLVSSLINFTNIVSNLSNGLSLLTGVTRSNVSINTCSNNYVANSSISSIIDSYFELDNCSWSNKNNSTVTGINVTISNAFKSKVFIGNVYHQPTQTSVASSYSTFIDSDLFFGNITASNGGYTSIQLANSDLVRLYPIGTYLPNTTQGHNVQLTGSNNRVIFIDNAMATTISGGTTQRIVYQNYAGTLGDCRISDSAGSINSDNSTRHTTTGWSWALSPNTNAFSYALSLTLPIAKVYLTSGSSTTISVWMYRNNTDTIPGIKCVGGQLGGLASDVYIEGGMAINTWTQYSISLTPTESGVVEIIAYAYSNGATSHTAWFDDISVA